MKQPTHDACQKLAAAIRVYVEKAEDDELLEELKDAGYVEPERTLQTVRSVERAVRSALSKTTSAVLSSMRNAVDLGMWYLTEFPRFRYSDNLAHRTARVFRKQFTSLIPRYVALYHADLNKQAGIDALVARTTNFVRGGWKLTDNALEYIEGWSKTLGGLMKVQEYDKLEKLITSALETGDSIPNLARKIRDAGIRDRPWKARRVALTETLRAQSVAQNEAFMTNPAVTAKKWIHTGSHKNNPRENHVDINGQTVPKDQPFTLIGADGTTYYPMYPRDPELPAGESVNCHCIMQAVTDDAITGLPDDEWNRLLDEEIARGYEDNGWMDALTEKYKAASDAYHAEHDEEDDAPPPSPFEL